MVMRRVGLLLLALGACSRPASTDAAQGANAPLAASASAAVPASTPAEAPPVVPLAVGMSDTSPPPAPAVKENDAGVALLAKGKADEAVTKLRHAVELAPGFVLARYNLACALARAADLDGAERELALVLEADWIGLRAQIARDEDLALFRASAQGKRLAAKQPDLEARYATALERGVRAMIWHARSATSSEPSSIRLGVWDARTKRFVATSERKKNVIAAYASSDLPYGVLVTGNVPAMIAGDMGDHVNVTELSYWPFTTAGAPLATTRVELGAITGTVRASGDQVELTLRSGIGAYGPPDKNLYEARFSWSPSRGATKKEVATKLTETPEDARRGRGKLGLPFHNGVETWSASPGYSFKGRELKLPDGRAVALPKAIQVAPTKPSIAASPAGDLVALVWDSHSCGDACGGNVFTVGAHRVVTVKPASGTAERIAEGTGVGAVRFDPSGRMFVQRDRKVFEWGAAPAALPDGVLLVAPVAREQDIQCCGF